VSVDQIEFVALYDHQGDGSRAKQDLVKVQAQGRELRTVELLPSRGWPAARPVPPSDGFLLVWQVSGHTWTPSSPE
jgi:hypothetical protein